MNLDTFNEEYYPFYIEVGYTITDIPSVTDEELEKLYTDLEAGLEAAVEKGFREGKVKYFLLLSGYGNRIATVPVDTDSFDQEVPQEFFETVKNYRPFKADF
ncbi:hypothetical protein [Gloeothece verrucosa]|uniref:Uncharacterized protein n=1 Tax=Gloeothece verrucosa (strain PCC 7822) TaxID=497965 RepID=E0UEN3_GLOV7|nr:hypothetical protein [Gloeothece verrucosa]ADN16601.1 hypothetical protein Cyan7822_4696 [Gloeothece verrucosa PCC 7822]